MTVISELPAFELTVAGVTVKHNAVKWRIATNRHPNIDRTDWGWIEHSPGHVCWSNNERFNEAAAAEMVRLHNQWLEDQKPVSIRLIEAREECEAARKRYDDARAKSDRAVSEWNKWCDKVSELSAELIAASQPPDAGEGREGV